MVATENTCAEMARALVQPTKKPLGNRWTTDDPLQGSWPRRPEPSSIVGVLSCLSWQSFSHRKVPPTKKPKVEAIIVEAIVVAAIAVDTQAVCRRWCALFAFSFGCYCKIFLSIFLIIWWIGCIIQRLLIYWVCSIMLRLCLPVTEAWSLGGNGCSASEWCKCHVARKNEYCVVLLCRDVGLWC